MSLFFDAIGAASRNNTQQQTPKSSVITEGGTQPIPSVPTAAIQPQVKEFRLRAVRVDYPSPPLDIYSIRGNGVPYDPKRHMSVAVTPSRSTSTTKCTWKFDQVTPNLEITPGNTPLVAATAKGGQEDTIIACMKLDAGVMVLQGPVRESTTLIKPVISKPFKPLVQLGSTAAKKVGTTTVPGIADIRTQKRELMMNEFEVAGGDGDFKLDSEDSEEEGRNRGGGGRRGNDDDDGYGDDDDDFGSGKRTQKKRTGKRDRDDF
eukprot:PhF_6_TR3451/c0_g2_i2/m.5033